jgi:hypothetical protein
MIGHGALTIMCLATGVIRIVHGDIASGTAFLVIGALLGATVVTAYRNEDVRSILGGDIPANDERRELINTSAWATTGQLACTVLAAGGLTGMLIHRLEWMQSWFALSLVMSCVYWAALIRHSRRI